MLKRPHSTPQTATWRGVASHQSPLGLTQAQGVAEAPEARQRWEEGEGEQEQQQPLKTEGVVQLQAGPRQGRVAQPLGLARAAARS